MAKQTPSKNAVSRIRFIMLDAEIPEGDLSQITSAIQNALKPATTIIQQRVSSSAPHAALTQNISDTELGEEEIFDDEIEEQVPQTKPVKPSRTRKPTTPEVIDFDFTSDPSLTDFASKHSAESEPERFLIIAAWFKEHRDTSSVTTAHIYTGYRLIGWSVGFEDFGWPLRYLKKQKVMSSSAQGTYDINHLGLDRVKKLRVND